MDKRRGITGAIAAIPFYTMFDEGLLYVAELKARLLHAGTANLTGVKADDFIAASRAGPGAGKTGSVFSMDGRRVRLTLSSPARSC